MLDIAKFIYHQLPIFWYALAATFFLLGLLYANVAWRSSKRRVRQAERSQLQLLSDRDAALADRQRKQQQQNWPVGTPNAKTEITENLSPTTSGSPSNASLGTSPAMHRIAAPEDPQPSSPPATQPTQAAALASLFSSSYQSSEAPAPNGNGDHHSGSTKHQFAVRPNPWTNYK